MKNFCVVCGGSGHITYNLNGYRLSDTKCDVCLGTGMTQPPATKPAPPPPPPPKNVRLFDCPHCGVGIEGFVQEESEQRKHNRIIYDSVLLLVERAKSDFTAQELTILVQSILSAVGLNSEHIDELRLRIEELRGENMDLRSKIESLRCKLFDNGLG